MPEKTKKVTDRYLFQRRPLFCQTVKNLVCISASVFPVNSWFWHNDDHVIQTKNINSSQLVKMAAASSEGLPTSPSSSLQNERNVSRSPSVSSLKDFQWTALLVSRPVTRKILKSRGNTLEFTCLPICVLFIINNLHIITLRS